MSFSMQEHILKNGIILTIEDLSKILSGDLWFIRLKVTSVYYLTSQDDELKYYCGDKIVKAKTIERPAVHEKDLDEVKGTLVESYLKSTLHYMETPRFLKRFKEKELKDQIEKIAKERKMREAGVLP